MIKKRIAIWFLILAIAIVINYSGRIFGSISNFFDKLMTESEVVELNVRFDEDNPSLKNSFFSLGKMHVNDELDFKFIHSNSMDDDNNVDIIIERSTDDVTKHHDGYACYKKLLYSPIVCFSKTSDRSSSKILTEISNRDSQSYQTDLEPIFEAFMSDGSWKKNLKESGYFSGDIKIYIPNKKSVYYDDVCEYILLNMYDTPTDETNRKEREEALETVLAKCEEVDIADFVTDDDNFGNGGFLIAPEFLESISSGYVEPFYGLKSNAVAYDVFVKDRKETFNSKLEEGKTIEFDSNKDVISYIKNDYRFFASTGFRVKDKTYDFYENSYSNCMLEYVDISE